MELLNEKKYTDEELKKYAGKYQKKEAMSTSKIPGFKSISPDGLRSRLEYDIKEYNKYVKMCNKLREDMIAGRVKDADNSTAKKTLQSYYNKMNGLMKKSIGKYAKMGASAEEKGKATKSQKEADYGKEMKYSKEKEDRFKKKAETYLNKMMKQS